MVEHGDDPDQSTGAIRWGARLEHRRPGARYGIVLALLLATFAFMASGVSGSWVPLVTVLLQGATLLAALAAAEARFRVGRLAAVVIALGLASGVYSLVQGSAETRGATALLNLLLVAVAPIAIAGSLVRRRRIDIDTVLGAICVYVLFGMFFAFAYSAIGDLGQQHFFAQNAADKVDNFLYFSFVTLTTVGYGDLTAAGGLGRAVAVLEALVGQLYLVTVVALVVSQLAGRRSESGGP